MPSALLPKSIIDKNGKRTTVYTKPDSASGATRLVNPKATASKTHRPKPVISFDFGKDAIEAYTTGDCWVLARNLARQTNLPAIGIMTDETTHGWCHWGTLLPNGQVVDVMGVWDKDDWVAGWDSYTTPVRTWVASEYDMGQYLYNNNGRMDAWFEESDNVDSTIEVIVDLIAPLLV